MDSKLIMPLDLVFSLGPRLKAKDWRLGEWVLGERSFTPIIRSVMSAMVKLIHHRSRQIYYQKYRNYRSRVQKNKSILKRRNE